MACEGEVPFNSLQVLSQAKRVCNSPQSLQNENNDLIVCNLKSCSLTTFKKVTISLEKEPGTHLDYKSGAVYQGGLVDNHKFGHGTFLWPNGDRYIGDFKLNSRHGFG